MTRKIDIAGKKYEASKSEAAFVHKIQWQAARHISNSELRRMVKEWIESAASDESRQRRLIVGIALNLYIPY